MRRAHAAMALARAAAVIEFRNVSKHYRTQTRRKVVLDGLTLTLPWGAKVGVLGRNGAGKSTLLGMISGTVRPDTGEIVRHGAISWPLGFGGSFHPELTGIQNVRFVARIYGVDTEALVASVADFSELGDFMDMPVRSYSSGMRARLAFGMSMGIDFDWYLVDEITAVGDTAFRRKSLRAFRTRLKAAGILMVSHSVQTIRSYCTSGLVLEGGEARYFEDVRAAIAHHEANMAAA
jgi:capsular polysaccharide transport system ATP-binding protein